MIDVGTTIELWEVEMILPETRHTFVIFQGSTNFSIGLDEKEYVSIDNNSLAWDTIKTISNSYSHIHQKHEIVFLHLCHIKLAYSIGIKWF